MILQGPGYDFRRRGGTTINQNHNRKAVGEISRMGIITMIVIIVAAAGRDHLATFKKGIGDRYRLVEKPPRIVTQIENNSLQLVSKFLLEFFHGLFQAVIGLFVESGDADISDIFFDT